MKQSVASAPVSERSSSVTAIAGEGKLAAERAEPVAERSTSAPNPATPFPAAGVSAGYAEAAPMTDGALAKAPEPAPAGLPDVEGLRDAVVAALGNGGHNSAAELLRAASFRLEGATVRIEVPGVGKKMLALTVNAAAEKIVRQELQRLGAPSRFLAVPGEGAASSAAPASVAPTAGSVQEAALAHPLVGRAREIFHAEVRSVVDLRRK